MAYVLIKWLEEGDTEQFSVVSTKTVQGECIVGAEVQVSWEKSFAPAEIIAIGMTF